MPYIDDVWDRLKWLVALALVLWLGIAIGWKWAVRECEGVETVEARDE